MYSELSLYSMFRSGHPKVVQELLGHPQISVTLDIYGHVLPDMQREAMAKMDALLVQ